METDIPASRIRRVARLGGAVLSGAALALGMSGWAIPWVGWVAVIPLFVALWGVSLRWAAALGFVAGVIRAAAGWHGRAPTVNLMTGGSETGPGMYVTLCLLWGTELAVYAVCHVWLCRGFEKVEWRVGRLAVVGSVAMLWVAFEYGTDLANESLALVFFPNLGASQWSWPACMQVSAWTGVYGVSFVLAAWSMAWAYWWRRRDRMALGVAGILAMLCVGCGGLRLLLAKEAQGTPVRAAILQGNVDPHEKLDRSREKAIAERYFRLCREANAAGAKLVVWTEGAIPWGVEEGDAFLERILGLTCPSGATHLLGMWLHSGSEATNVYYNAALLLLPDGRVVDAYRKTAPMPDRD